LKYDPHIQPLETDGFGETRNFAIAATGKAFRNLMDGLYSRKIEAVVREISTNAYDSHTEAGTRDRRFLVQLPTTWKPTFSVRDYGVGMPHRQVMERYSTLFDSTKDQSDEQVGMLGLGSKSPFAYTDGFTLRCWDGEYRRTYASYLGQGGVPMISLADTSPSTEPRGAEVSFPVKHADVPKFAEAALRVYKGFSTPPLGLPQDLYAKLQPPVRVEGDRWAMVSRDWLPGSRLWALQGCVLYPLEIEQVEKDASAVRVFQYVANSIVLDFDIGELEFTPGRETLSYSDRTLTNIAKRWTEFRRTVAESYEDRFADCATGFERAVRANSMQVDTMYGGLFKLTATSKEIELINHRVASAVRYEDRTRYGGSNGDNDKGSVHIAVAADGEVTRVRSSKRSKCPSGAVYKQKRVVFVHRTPGILAPWKRVAHYLKQNGFEMALAHEEDDADNINWDEFGNPPVIQLEDMPKPPPAPRNPTVWDRYKVFEPLESYDYSSGGQWDDPDEDDPRLKNAPVVFVHKNFVVTPHPTLPAAQWAKQYNIYQLTTITALEVAAGRPAPVQVRMRAGEVYKKWARMRQFTHDPNKLVADLTPTQVKWLIDLQNYRRFENSVYAGMVKKAVKYLANEASGYKETGYMGGRAHRPLAAQPYPADNPLLKLERFYKRDKAIPFKKRSSLNRMLNGLPAQSLDYLVTRGLQQGLEVLPEPCTMTKTFPMQMLPLHWENLGRMLADNIRYPFSMSRALAEYSKKE
jgi:hypothetical protein